MARGQVLRIVTGGSVWRIEGRDGSILRLRPEWSRQQLQLLASELQVPLVREL